MINFHLPLNEVIFDFHDRIKSISQGYASFDYEITDYQSGKLDKVNILVNGEIVESLAFITHKEKAVSRGRTICSKLKDSIPKQLFKVAIQAAIGSKVIARETLGSMRKDVIAKCYGGDVTRKRKLLEKQKAGKKKMKQVGNVNIPQEAFLAAIKLDNYMNKKKALIILPSYSTGGAEKVIWSYFKNFKNSKISLKLLVVNSKDSCDNFKNKNIINLNYSRFIYSIPKILSILKSENINVIILLFQIYLQYFYF